MGANMILLLSSNTYEEDHMEILSMVLVIQRLTNSDVSKSIKFHQVRTKANCCGVVTSSS